MKKVLIGILGTTWLLTAIFADPAEGQDAIVQEIIAPRIINGTPTDAFESVGIVGIERLGGIGTGTLIGPRHVLTAAHIGDLVATPSDGTFEVNGRVYTTSWVHVHEDYSPRTLKNDIAIYELSEVVEGVSPSPIYRGIPLVGDELTLVGFGAGGDGNSGQDGTFGVKMFGTTTIDAVTETEIIWLFDSTDESNTAPGDSGGPAFLYLNDEFFVAGVTSGGSEPDSVFGDVTFDTRVDAFAEWIDLVLAMADDGDDDPPDDGDDDPPDDDPPDDDPSDGTDGPPCQPGGGKHPGHGLRPGGWKHVGHGPHPGMGKHPGQGFHFGSNRPPIGGFRPGGAKRPGIIIGPGTSHHPVTVNRPAAGKRPGAAAQPSLAARRDNVPASSGSQLTKAFADPRQRVGSLVEAFGNRVNRLGGARR